MFGFLESGFRITADLGEIRRNVVGVSLMDQWSAIGDCLFEIDLDLKRLVIHLDKQRGIFRGVTVCSDNHRDRLSDIVDVVLGKRALGARIRHRRMRDQQGHFDIERTDVFGCVDRRDARMLAGRGNIDTFDFRTCERAAYERHMKRTRKGNVIDKRTLAGKQLRIRVSLYPCTEHSGGHGCLPRSAIAEIFGRLADGPNDIGVSSATAKIAREHLPYAMIAQIERVAGFKMTGNGHNHARRAIAALQCMTFRKRLLNRMERAIFAGHRFNRADLRTIRLHGQCQAGPCRAAVDHHGAGTANAVFAAHMCTGKTQFMAQKIGQQQARTDLKGLFFAVDGHPDCGLRVRR